MYAAACRRAAKFKIGSAKGKRAQDPAISARVAIYPVIRARITIPSRPFPARCETGAGRRRLAACDALIRRRAMAKWSNFRNSKRRWIHNFFR